MNNFFKILLLISSLIFCMTVSSPSYSQAQVVFSDPVQLNQASLNGPGFIKGDPGFILPPFIISPDGQRIVYLSRQSDADVMALFSVLANGGKPILLDTFTIFDSQTDFTVTDVKISPDSQYVIYKKITDFIGASELLSVPIDGGDQIKLNTQTAFNNGVINFEVSSDSLKVVFTVLTYDDLFSFNYIDLFSTPITGGSLTKLDNQEERNKQQLTFKITPDGQRVVYNRFILNEAQIISTPISGGAAMILDSGEVFDFVITPNSQQVLYRADFPPSLYRVPVTGGVPVKVVDDSFGQRSGNSFLGIDATAQISPDGQYLVFLNSSNELQSVSITKAETPRFIESIADSSVQIPSPLSTYFQISPDSQKVVYRTFTDTNKGSLGLNGLFSTSILGAQMGTVRLSPAFGPAIIVITGEPNSNPSPNLPEVGVLQFSISQDSQRVLYLADLDSPNVIELFGTSIDRFEKNKLNGSLVTDGNVSSADFLGANSERVLYSADQDIDGTNELYSAHFDGRAAIKISGELPQNESLAFFKLSLSGRNAVYSTGLNTNRFAQENLFSTKVTTLTEFCFPIIPPNGDAAMICL